MISRWEPTSQICSCCGFLGGKLDLSICEWECFNFGAKHGRIGSGRSIETKMHQEIYWSRVGIPRL
ncbi:MAG: hypothetical protein MGG11_06330 [Trichodesmium sp. MAG_R03]|nr:hypothetical protein [Trichodesmium sp. MAG_R03]